MAGGSSGQNDIVWPGYVAAMASLLLSLLLVCAVLVMTIGQIGGISDKYQQTLAKIGLGSMQDIARLAKLAGISEDAATIKVDPAIELDAASGAPLAASGLAAKFHSTRFGRKPSSQDGADGVLPLDLNNGLFDREAAMQAAALAAQDRQLLAQVDLSKIDIRKIRFKNLDFSGVSLYKGLTPEQMAKVDFSEVNFGQLSQSLIHKVKPLLAKEAIRYQLELLRVGRKAPPPAPVVVAPPPPAAPVPPPEHLRLVFSDETWEIGRTQKQQFQIWLKTLKPSTDPILLWAEIPGNDDHLQRSVFARLQLVKSWLVDAGLPAERLRIALRNTATAPLRDMTFHIELQKR
jgi:hypothetical protein